MNAPFRLYGAELSPYSVKVRSYLRFKGIPFEWLQRTQARQEEFARYAKLPLVPVLVDANDNAMQDSTPMIEALEREFPEPVDRARRSRRSRSSRRCSRIMPTNGSTRRCFIIAGPTRPTRKAPRAASSR